MTLHQPAPWARPDRPTAPFDPSGDAIPRAATPAIELGEIVGAVRRRWLPLALWLVCCLALAGWYLRVTPTEFTASASVILEPRRPLGTPTPTVAPVVLPALDVAQAESQIQVIRSERVLAAVFDTLDLANAPELAALGPGLRERVVALLGLSDASRADAADVRARAYQAFEERVTVRRLGQSYVLEVSYRAGTPEQAARIANAVTAQYLKAQIDAKAAAVEQGTEYLQGRITTLRAEQAAALQGVRDGRIPDMQFSDADARVIGAALRPLGKSSPKTGLILAFALTFGALSGLLAVAIRQTLDRTFRRRQQVWPALGVECLGVLPRLGRVRAAPSRREHPRLGEAAAHPASPFAQGCRGVRTAVLLSAPSQRRHSIGLVSWSPGEGRTTVAANLAAVMAVARDTVALVDADVLNPALTAALERDAGTPRCDPKPSQRPPAPTFVALDGRIGARETDGDLSSAGIEAVLTPLRAAGDVVFDLPPLGTSPDALALGAQLDGVILVIEANRTTIEEAAEAVRTLQAVNIRVLGAVLNKAEPAAARRRGARRPEAAPAT